ncbi:hypothetical protein [Streptomyces sp. B21-083]|uniref:hypothetical protein n=1 Tax=Streptomyces sp. B21-083 TaxID=3039410 RepID=UPI002FF41667
MQIGAMPRLSKHPQTSTHEAADLEQAGVDIAFLPTAYGFDAPTAFARPAAPERLRTGIIAVHSHTPALTIQTTTGLDAVTGLSRIVGYRAATVTVPHVSPSGPRPLNNERLKDMVA